MSRCPECGAPLPPNGACRENFNAMLALEWQVPDGAGSLAHFYAVSAYLLQHPDTMRYTVESLAWLRSAVRSSLEGEATVGDIRSGARRHGAEARVTRRDGDPVQQWHVRAWTTNVSDVLAAGVDGYRERVERWAASVLGDLDASES